MPRITVVTDKGTVVDIIDIDDSYENYDLNSPIHRESIKDTVIEMLTRAYKMQENGE